MKSQKAIISAYTAETIRSILKNPRDTSKGDAQLRYADYLLRWMCLLLRKDRF
jgi:hypothetical protein